MPAGFRGFYITPVVDTQFTWLLSTVGRTAGDVDLFLYPDNPERLAKIIVDNLPAPFWGPSSHHLGPGSFCRPSCV